ncbi:Uncharacterized conserved protein, tellurite resistance protein B (TerB) family [Cnuella takakiae]|uniref:Uncharacterized conserved protein, tellurite resistance protein B (TerB) family n=1 Tax=Cnuella takakiae TaxID=1302690 RepID=A0A1M4XU45_9BACT|nr:TerB family tellurite resistance protein [Cnuella takakiae]OLY92939.1 hypothetical protein BUE76_14355 [Cnuella takakiae]SHE96762.1 Uncharacterized conserved protein, tellurite resistance protein B (TerB) family [Cnuella takakiae]
MEQGQTTILSGAPDTEKGAYLAVIASLATADRQASEEETEYLTALCESAELSEAQTQQVLAAGRETNDSDLQRNLDVLKHSDLRFSLVTDLITFAKADQSYTQGEQQHIQLIANHLGVDQNQFQLLNQYSDQAAQLEDPQVAASPNFLANNGMQQKMQNAGINTNGLLKGLLSFAGPMILASMLRRRGGGMMGGGMMGGGLGGMLGGMLGGGGGMMGGMGRGGGLGSLIGMLSGGRGMSGAGGMLGRVFGNRF